MFNIALHVCQVVMASLPHPIDGNYIQLCCSEANSIKAGKEYGSLTVINDEIMVKNRLSQWIWAILLQHGKNNSSRHYI